MAVQPCNVAWFTWPAGLSAVRPDRFWIGGSRDSRRPQLATMDVVYRLLAVEAVPFRDLIMHVEVCFEGFSSSRL